MKDKSCQDCRHWRRTALHDLNIQGQGDYGECGFITPGDEARDLPALLHASPSHNTLTGNLEDGDAQLITRADFHCQALDPRPGREEREPPDPTGIRRRE